MLLLFDIDGTLLKGAADAHRDALHVALHEVYGVRDSGRVDGLQTAGRTDIEIARDVLLRRGVSAERIDTRLDDLRTAWARQHAALIADDLSHTVTPGVRELLETLRGRSAIKLSLVTGNLEAIARLKLARAGIGEFFARGQGAFGSDHESRAELPPIARRRAGANGEPYPRARTIVVGDTPRDIACAHADGLRCVAVASGPYAADALAGADAVARDGRELAGTLEPLLDR